MALEDYGAKAAVALGALGFVLAEMGSITGPIVDHTVLAGLIVAGSFIALLGRERSLTGDDE